MPSSPSPRHDDVKLLGAAFGVIVVIVNHETTKTRRTRRKTTDAVRRRRSAAGDVGLGSKHEPMVAVCGSCSEPIRTRQPACTAGRPSNLRPTPLWPGTLFVIFVIFVPS